MEGLAGVDHWILTREFKEKGSYGCTLDMDAMGIEAEKESALMN